MHAHKGNTRPFTVRSAVFAAVFAATVFALGTTGCSGLQTRGDLTKPVNKAPPPIVTSQPLPNDQGAAALPPAPTPLPLPAVVVPGTSAPAPVGPETFLSKELPKVGLILGPGGMKAYAHVGVLREFARARIPVQAIAGLEWGAMMAAFYAEKGLANDVDWKAFRLRDSDLPSGGVLRGYRAKSIDEFESYLGLVFNGGSVEKAKVPFGCPSIFKREKIVWQQRGSFKDVVAKCIPFPPLLGDTDESMAAASAVDEASQWLRGQGANLIILVNVLGAGETLSSRLAEDQYGTSVLWTETRRNLLKVRSPVVHWNLSVNTSSVRLDDFGARKTAVELGAKAAVDMTAKLSKQYGF